MQPLERGGVAAGGPQLELGVACRPQLQQGVVAAIVQLDAGDRLRVAAIEAFGEPQNRGERADHAPARRRKTPRSARCCRLGVARR